MTLLKTPRILKTAAVLSVLGAGLLLGACETSPTEPVAEKAAPDVLCETGPYLIHLSGQCRVAGSHRIVCEDETTTTPRDKVLNVVFQLRNAETGAPVETKSVNPGVIPREVSFSGLAQGTYEIRHTVQARDCSATFTTYAGLDVFMRERRSPMSTKPAVREVTGRWVPVAEEPRWVSLQAERVQEPPVLGAGKVEPYSAHYELLYCRNELVTFDLAALRTVITIQPAKGEKD